MAKRRETAYVIVDREWWVSSVAKLLEPYPPGTGDLHRIRGPLVEMVDGIGIWIGEAPANLRHTKDNSRVMMKILIPWDRVIAFGIIDEPGRQKLGFSVEAVGPEEASV